MELLQVKTDILDRAFAELPPKMDTPEARVMLLAIGLQESRFTATRQLVGNPPKPVGPAVSYWQGEQGGGMVQGVRVHAATRDLAAEAYKRHGVNPDNASIWKAIEKDQVLACILARLLLYTHPFALPKLGDQGGAWRYYMDVWRPGKPHAATWPGYCREAMKFIQGS